MKAFRHLFISVLLAVAGLAATSCDLTENGLNDIDSNISSSVTEEEKEEDEKDEDSNDNQEGGEEGGQNKPEPIPGEFVILFTNDFHSQIEPLSKDETYNADRGGAKRIKALVDSVRAAEPVVLLADAGDLVQGTYYFSLLNGVVEMMILNELSYDVRTIGNHEFDKKMVGLGEMFAMSSVPVVATNYDFSNTALASHVKKSVILDAGTLKVGFVGLNVRLENLVDPTACEGVGWQNACLVADIEAEKLRDEGADMVIALSHLGYEKDSDLYYYDRGFVKKCRHIDMVIGGHSHTFLNYADYVNDLDGDPVPIVQTGSKGICLGYAKIRLDDNGKPSFTYKLIPVKNHLDNKLDPVFSSRIDEYTEAVGDKMNEVLGYCPRAIRKSGDLQSPLGNLTADGLIWIAKEQFGIDADVSIYNTGGMRAEFSQGDMTLGDVYAVYPFDNLIAAVTVKGRDLRELFDAAATGLPINSSVRLVLDSNRNVSSVTINGEPLDDNKTYTVATTDYLINTGRYGLADPLTENYTAGYMRDYFGNYFRHLASENGGQITAATDDRIRIE